ncbi:MAG: antibiotic biosynthesis monooxygenase family protein [Ferrimicrobium sp.]|jgi:heme-degrading monooxygenase HmoA|uniref:Antibiotic biosynthesis monooxygenase n=1 Tax=Ferrimicrobium acidiphilum TaxID=121039 RepID=A0ABV3Y3Z6_9ACTN|nr:antibiotic biosynthesis monooxygenase family protein [Ferrimicrobium sp.]
MVIELATFHITQGQETAFHRAYLAARPHLAQSPGCRRADLRRVQEDASTFVLLVEWERIEDHLDGFRTSNAYIEWRRLLSPFFAVDPTVVHLIEP